MRDLAAEFEAVVTLDQSLALVQRIGAEAAAARDAADRAAIRLDEAMWWHVEFRGYPLAPAAAIAGVTRATAYKAIERAEARR